MSASVLVPIVTFALVAATVGGAYWMLVARGESAARRQLARRMRPEDPARRSRLALRESELGGPRRGPLGRIQRLIDRSGLGLTVPAFLFLSWMCALGVALLLFLRFNQPIVAAGGIVGLPLPYFWVRRAAAARMWTFEEQFPEAIDLIARALRAGHAFPTGLQMVADELGSPVGPEFKLIYDRQNYGMALPDALRAFADRVPLLDARFFVTAVLTQREAGGNLSGVLDNLSAVIRERFKVKRQVRVVSAHGRMTAAILMALPPFVGAAQASIAPDNFNLLIAEPLGVKMLIAAAVLQIVGMVVISRLVKVEY